MLLSACTLVHFTRPTLAVTSDTSYQHNETEELELTNFYIRLSEEVGQLRDAVTFSKQSGDNLHKAKFSTFIQISEV